MSSSGALGWSLLVAPHQMRRHICGVSTAASLCLSDQQRLCHCLRTSHLPLRTDAGQLRLAKERTVARRNCAHPSVLVRDATVGDTAGGRYTTPSSAQSIRSAARRVRNAVTARCSARSSLGEGRRGGGAKAAATLSKSRSSSITDTARCIEQAGQTCGRDNARASAPSEPPRGDAPTRPPPPPTTTPRRPKLENLLVRAS